MFHNFKYTLIEKYTAYLITIFQKKLDTIPLFVHINCESIPNSKWFFFFFAKTFANTRIFKMLWFISDNEIQQYTKIIFQKNYYNTGQPSISWRNASCSLGK